MSTGTTKIRARLAKLDKSLDELEAQLEPLFAQSLPETLLALDTIQQAKLQTIIPYVVYDLVFVYLKSRGMDPKTHRVVAELERVRQYFDKIKHAEDVNQKRTHGIDKAAAGRFIKHAIAQAKNAQLVDEPEDTDAAPIPASSSSNHERVPIKVTSKMMARAEYEEALKELGSEEEDDLEVFDEGIAIEDDEAMNTDDAPQETMSAGLDKGKGRASDEEQSMAEEAPALRYKRPRVDPFSGYDNLSLSESTQIADQGETPTQSPLVNDLRKECPSRMRKIERQKSCEKKGKRKAKKAINS